MGLGDWFKKLGSGLEDARYALHYGTNWREQAQLEADELARRQGIRDAQEMRAQQALEMQRQLQEEQLAAAKEGRTLNRWKLAQEQLVHTAVPDGKGGYTIQQVPSMFGDVDPSVAEAASNWLRAQDEVRARTRKEALDDAATTARLQAGLRMAGDQQNWGQQFELAMLNRDMQQENALMTNFVNAYRAQMQAQDPRTPAVPFLAWLKGQGLEGLVPGLGVAPSLMGGTPLLPGQQYGSPGPGFGQWQGSNGPLGTGAFNPTLPRAGAGPVGGRPLFARGPNGDLIRSVDGVNWTPVGR